MQELRANTEVIVTVGPFVDVGDGFTPQTDIDIALTDEAELMKHGAELAVSISGNTWAPATMVGPVSLRGYYSLTLTAGNLNTEGLLVVIIQDDDQCLPIKQEYMVLLEAVWDAKYDTDVVGTPVDLDSSSDATLAGMLKKMADDNGGSSFDAETDSQTALADAITAAAPQPYNPTSNSAINTGNQDANTYAACAADNSTRWTIGDEDGTNTIDVTCDIEMGTNRTAQGVTINGYFTRSGGGGHIVEIYARDYTVPGNTDWTKLSAGTAATEMRSRVSDADYEFSLPASATCHEANGSDAIGDVQIRFVSTRGTTAVGDVLYLDYVSVAGASTGAVSSAATADAVWQHTDGEAMRHIPKYTGEIRYVDEGNGSDEHEGWTPDESFATIKVALAASSAGDMIVVKAGTYDEGGLTIALDALELRCEAGTILEGTGATALTITADNVVVSILDIQPDSDQKGLVVTGEYFRPTDVYVHGAHTISYEFSAAAEHAYLTRCRCDNYTITGYDVAAPEMLMDRCYALGRGAAVRGFYLRATAKWGFYNLCVSLDNATASFETIAGANDNQFYGCADSKGCGDVLDNGSDNAWRNFGSIDSPEAGVGARTVTVTVNDGADAIESARVRFTKGAATYIQSTDASGEATFNLDDGSYTVAISLIGYTYGGSTEVITGDATPTYSMTAQTITAPGDVTLCTVQFNVKLGNTAVEGAVCKAKLLGVNQAADGTILSNEELSGTTDNEGMVELQLVRKDAIVKGSGIYKIWVEIDGKPVASVETTIPNQKTAYFEDLL